MLAANVCAGSFIARHKQPVLYRVHDVPSEEKVAALRAFLAELGLQLPGGDIPKPRDYAALLEKIRGRPDFNLLQTVLLRSLKQAVYTPENVGHFGLAYEAYVHFTSPIRRYPDLLVHRAIKALLAGKRYDGGLDWRRSGATAPRPSGAPTTPAATSRAGSSATTCASMSARPSPARSPAWCPSAVRYARRLFCRRAGAHLGARPRLLPVRRRAAPAHGERTKKRFRLADRMTVKLVRVDVDQRKIDLVPA